MKSKELEEFDKEEDIIYFLENEIINIEILDECRLYREEQMAISEELLIYRNCVEWLRRLNKIIENIKYSLYMCLQYSKTIKNPLNENNDYKMYAYYLEDTVYRELVLWDIFRQLMNEFYQCGIDKTQPMSIHKFIKDQKDKIGEKDLMT